MTEELFADDWAFENLETGTSEVVRLPHDAMIARTRAADAPSGYHGAYFPGGRYLYRKQWKVESDAASRRHRLRFEGIGGAAEIVLNGTVLASVDSRYRDTAVDLDEALRPGETNVIEVRVDDTRQPNSRWYTGSGLYRPVWLDVTGASRFAVDGVRVTTEAIGEVATLALETHIEGDGTDVAVRVVLRAGSDVVADETGPVGRLTLAVPSPRLWDDVAPFLYDAGISLVVDGMVTDERAVRIGIRIVSVDPKRGLRINGTATLLRGACIHHDSGILGAATFRAFEFRRARILKENGYNAVRSSHNPLSRDMLDACDEVGLYVMDELTDVWSGPKTAHDASSTFTEAWPDDLAAMIAKDRNHASVIMYSIGNEIAESGSAAGIEVAGRLSAFTRELDPTRPTTLAVNFLLNVLAGRGQSVFNREEKPKKKQSAATSTTANVIANKIGAITQLVSRLPAADTATREVFATVDVAGYNYAWSRYRGDARKHSERVVVGSESMPGDIARIWTLAQEIPSVIGDFMWTGWDYLGETGLGDWAYGEESVPLTKPYPQITAGTGAIDITGHPGVAALLARAVWGQLDGPAIAVRPLDHAGEKVRRSAWRSSDAIASWAWQGAEGKRAEVEVYSDADEVELLLGGRSLGKRRAGARAGYVARFTVPYQRGELTAVERRGGRETGRATLRSAGRASLVLEAETSTLRADGQDLAFIRVEVRDERGTVEMLDDDQVTLTIDGPATLAGFGNGASANSETYASDSHSTYYGRALAIVRAGVEDGAIVVRATSKRHGTAEVHLSIEQ